jgi:hypothetical protein
VGKPFTLVGIVLLVANRHKWGGSATNPQTILRN